MEGSFFISIKGACQTLQNGILRGALDALPVK